MPRVVTSLDALRSIFQNHSKRSVRTYKQDFADSTSSYVDILLYQEAEESLQYHILVKSGFSNRFSGTKASIAHHNDMASSNPTSFFDCPPEVRTITWENVFNDR